LCAVNVIFKECGIQRDT